MDFRRGRRRDEPEINFIPLIDLLLVVLIFLMVTTSYSRFADLKLNLPTIGARPGVAATAPLAVGLDAKGEVRIGDGKTLALPDAATLSKLLTAAAAGNADHPLVIYADEMTPHRNVMRVLEAARLAGLNRVTFAATARRAS